MAFDTQNQQSCDSNVLDETINESNLSDIPMKQCFSTSTSSTGCVGVDSGAFKLFAGAWGERGVRKYMEDTHIVCPSIYKLLSIKDSNFPECFDAAVFAIFDGHGGKQTSVFCRDNLITEIGDTLMNYYSNIPADEFFYTDRHVRKLLRKVMNGLNSRIAAEMPSCKDGTTVIIAFYPYRQCNTTMYIASLGDTAAYLSRVSKGVEQSIPLNEMHKPWMVNEKARIVQAGGVVESGRVNGLLEVSRSLGDLSLKKYGVTSCPSFTKLTINYTMDNFILLGCDGFWINWTAVEALTKAKELLFKENRRLITQGDKDPFPNLENICQDLVNHVLLEKKSQDNVTLYDNVLQKTLKIK